MNCEVCNARVSELRRGRCWGCYNRWVDARAVGIGARCCICTERRRDVLRSIELLGAWVPICYTCSGKAMRLDPLPQTMAEIRSILARERRSDERRHHKKDTRVFQYERRGDDRRDERQVMSDDWLVIDEDMIIDIEEILDAKVAERASDALPRGKKKRAESAWEELTSIREIPG